MDFNMKKLITLALIVGAIALTQAQSNLVFNRVLNFTVSSSVSATVPEGKVWKVEHNSGDLRIDKADVAYGLGISNVPLWNVNKPTWYSEGTVLFTSSSFSSLSILEFNVVPISSSSGGSGGGVSADGLIFSQVINYSDNAIAYNANTSATWTDTIVIPEGKVWKIMSFSVVNLSSLNNQISDCNGCIAEFDNLVAYSRYISGYSPPTNQYPMFINEGVKELRVYNGSNSFNLRVSFTAVEYNSP